MSYSHRRRFLFVLFVAGLLLIAIVANATTLVHLRFQELVGYSTAIARVHCLGAETLMDRGEIWTDTRFRIVESEKGSLHSVIAIRQPGGEYQHLRARVDGTPQFQPGEEVYLFLVAAHGGKFNLVGWSQGTFRIHRDPRTATETVTQDSAAIPAYNPESRAFEKTGVKNMLIKEFVNQIRAAM